jgi:hypothetical protein
VGRRAPAHLLTAPISATELRVIACEAARAAGELLRERFGLEHVFLDAPNPV